MKHTKIFIAISAAVLSVAGFVATKASTKFAAFTHGRLINIVPGTLTLSSSNARLTSVKGSGAVTLWIATRANPLATTILHTVVTTVGSNVQLFLK